MNSIPVRAPASGPSGADTRRFSGKAISALVLSVVQAGILVAYYFILARLYIDYIYPWFSFQGLKLYIEPLRQPEALISVIGLGLLLPTRFERVSDLLAAGVLIFTAVPTAMLFVYGGMERPLMYSTVAMSAVLTCVRFIKAPRINFPTLKIDHILAACMVATLGGAAIAVWQVGLGSFDLNFIEVYDRRAVASNAIQGWMAYVVGYAVQANVLGSAITLFYKRYAIFAMFLAASFIFFGIIGQKSQIVLPFLLLLFNVLINRRGVQLIYISAFTILAVALIIYCQQSGDGLVLTAMTYRRMMIMPVVINAGYLEYFDRFGFLFWSYSKVGFGLAEYTDSLDPAFAIGYYLTGSMETHDNTGLVGSGYMNAGYWGIAIYSVVLALIASVIDRVAAEKNQRALATLLCVPMMQLVVITSDLPGMLLSGGLGFSLLALLVLPPKSAEDGRREGRRGPMNPALSIPQATGPAHGR